VTQAQPTSKASTQPRSVGEALRDALTDGSVWALVVANAVAIGIAVVGHWKLVELMAVYWAQSVLIGLACATRMSLLDRFTSGSFVGPPTRGMQAFTVVFFLAHYGGFHALYAWFLSSRIDAGALGAWFWAAVAGFVASHAWSLRRFVALDRRGVPSLSRVMFTPYLRVAPMHLTVLTGLMDDTGRSGVVLFSILKMGADVGMHLVEETALRRAAVAAPQR